MRLVKIATIVALFYVHSFALRYVLPSDATFGIYESRREWLTVHVLTGIFAIFIGPVQFWLASNANYRTWHRVMGVTYLMSVALSSGSAIYLARHTDFGWVFSTGMMALAFAWIATTGLAVVAISQAVIPQHKEWMVRSYVVTLSFVFFEATLQILDFAKIGTTAERMVVASWVSWSVPLLITELFLQGRKIFVARRAPTRLSIVAEMSDGGLRVADVERTSAIHHPSSDISA
jgi:uncharacterized membrane protein